MDKKIRKALLFAAEAHGNQRRKYTGEPYLVHPMAVSRLVVSAGGDRQMVVAALLHDTVEDTPVTFQDIRAAFGRDVMELVEDLTDVSRPQDGNRKVRKRIDREHTAMASPRAKTIKIADLIDNTRSIVEHDAAFARVYLAEKRLLLEVLQQGHPVLYGMAMRQLVECERYLETLQGIQAA